MRIALVGPAHPYKGGIAQHTTALAHHLAAAGHQVTIESWSAQYPARLYPGQLTVDEPEMPRFHPTRRDLSWRRPDGWFRHGRRIGRDSDLVVLTYVSPVQAPSYLTMLRALDRTGARRLVIAHNVRAHESHGVDRMLTRTLLRRADVVVVHSSEQALEAAALTDKEVREAALPAFFLGPSAEPLPGAAPEPRLQNSLLFFGMVRPYKGLDILLQALSITDSQPRLIVAGEFWQNEREVDSLISRLGLSARVTLQPGYVDATTIPSLFGAADALVLPYRKATGSQNAFLAFRYGLPVIATRTGALADSVQDGVNGVLCAPDDVNDLARAIDRFYQPGEPARLRAAVRRQDGSDGWNTYLEAVTGELLPGHHEQVI
jgi:glycosyltransferase involved in cell wall biosynthesis